MMQNQQLFNIEAIAKQYGVPAPLLDAMMKQARNEFGEDDMMVELHVLRAIRRSRYAENRKAAQG